MNEYRTDLNQVTQAAVASPNERPARPVYVAVVHAAGMICHICAATTTEQLAARLGAYVRVNATYQLWPSDAERVLDLLGAGRAQDAVDLYFAAVGLRWDREELIVERAGLGVEA